MNYINFQWKTSTYHLSVLHLMTLRKKQKLLQNKERNQLTATASIVLWGRGKKKDKGDFSYFKKWTDAKIPQMQTCSVMETVPSGHNTTFVPLRYTKSECKRILTKELASSCLTHKKTTGKRRKELHPGGRGSLQRALNSQADLLTKLIAFWVG